MEYLIWLGHESNAKGLWEVWIDDELMLPGVQAVIGAEKLPVIALHKMKKNNDGIEIKFSAPLIEGFTRINLRIFDEEGWDFVRQFKYYDISKAVKDIIPLEFSGRKARFEYRTDFGARTLLYLTLP